MPTLLARSLFREKHTVVCVLARTVQGLSLKTVTCGGCGRGGVVQQTVVLVPQTLLVLAQTSVSRQLLVQCGHFAHTVSRASRPA